MTSTRDLVEVYRRASAAGAKVLLVGDPRQLAAVGPGGALADVAAHGIRYELAEVRRFAAEWERAASLRLRDGDQAVLDEYAKHGRLVDAGTAEQAEAGAAPRLAGRHARRPRVAAARRLQRGRRPNLRGAAGRAGRAGPGRRARRRPRRAGHRRRGR